MDNVKQVLTVIGATSSKGNSVQTGAYDSSKVIVLMKAREVSSTGTSRGEGFMAATFKYGTSVNLENLVRNGVSFPCEAELEFEEVLSSNDTVVKTVVGFKFLNALTLTPVKAQQKAA